MDQDPRVRDPARARAQDRGEDAHPDRDRAVFAYALTVVKKSPTSRENPVTGRNAPNAAKQWCGNRGCEISEMGSGLPLAARLKGNAYALYAAENGVILYNPGFAL